MSKEINIQNRIDKIKKNTTSSGFSARRSVSELADCVEAIYGEVKQPESEKKTKKKTSKKSDSKKSDEKSDDKKETETKKS